MEKIKESFANNENNIKKILIGSCISIAFTIVGLLIFSLLLTYTEIKENTIPAITITISVISILIGSTIAISKTKKNGIINGALVASFHPDYGYSLSKFFFYL